MIYDNVVIGTFLSRPNRFIAQVLIDNQEETVHVKNTGRCKELLIPGVSVALAKGDNPNRKTKWDLIAVQKEGLGWVNIDSQACNKVVKEWLEENSVPYKWEVKNGNSRFDFLIDPDSSHSMWMEVKGCTLESRKVGYFPDAPTARGLKHVQELTQMAKEGKSCAICFVIQMEQVHCTHAMDHNDPAFSKALKEAKAAGVRIFHAQCRTRFNELKITTVLEENRLFQNN